MCRVGDRVGPGDPADGLEDRRPAQKHAPCAIGRHDPLRKVAPAAARKADPRAVLLRRAEPWVPVTGMAH